jgi:hypothetical protein
VNVNKVYANVRLAVPDATLVEINKYLLAELDSINARGVESLRKYAVVYPSTEGYGSPATRLDSQDFNYYPNIKCFILPSEVNLVEKIFSGNTQLREMSTADTMRETIPLKSYYIANTGELYLSFEPEDGDILTIVGRFGGQTVNTISDKYIPYLSNVIIAGLHSSEYKDPDAYAVYSRKAMDSKVVTNEAVSQTKGMKRNGRLY